MDRVIEYHELDVMPLTPEQQASMDYVLRHWRTNSTDTGLEWTPCGPDCTHAPNG